MKTAYSYLRLVLASCLFAGGIAMQFVPTPSGVERGVRRREQEMQAVPVDERTDWLRSRDIEDARTEAYLHVCGVFLGGIGLGAALYEAAYVSARHGKRCPLDAP